MSASPVEFTGERFVPECTGEIWAEHWHRYLFARRFQDGHAQWLGDQLARLIDDGHISTVVESMDDEGALLRVTRAKQQGSRLMAEKGLNFPDTAQQ